MTERILQHQLKAQLIYKRIQQAKREWLEWLETQEQTKEFKQKYSAILRKETIDPQTAALLKQLLVLPPKEEEDPMRRVAKETVKELMNVLAEAEKASKMKRLRIILSDEGDLYFESDSNRRYNFRSEKKRLAILQTLSSRYKQTSAIQYNTDSANTAAVRKSIGVINAKVKEYLKLTKRFIESNGNGYRINPTYTLIKK